MASVRQTDAFLLSREWRDTDEGVEVVLERTRDRMTKYLRRRGLLDDEDDDAEEGGASERAGLTRLAASAVSGLMPPAGPEWRRGALPITHRAALSDEAAE